jgi:hypothetical protein
VPIFLRVQPFGRPSIGRHCTVECRAGSRFDLPGRFSDDFKAADDSATQRRIACNAFPREPD